MATDLTTKLKIIARNLSKKAFSEVQKSLDDTTKRFETLAEKSQQSSHGITGSLNRLKGAIQANQEGFQSIAIGAGVVAVAAGAMTKGFIDAAMQMQRMKMSLTAVMGGAEAATKHFKQLEEVAKLPGLGLQEAVQGSIRLQSVGMSAEEATTQLTAFGSSVARVGGGREELARVVEQISQMAGKSEILMEDLRPIQSIMPDINKAMQAAFGTNNIEQIREMGITSRQFIANVTEELGKMPGVGDTAANALENLEDNVLKLKAALGESLLPMFSKVVNMLANVVEWFNGLSQTSKSIIAWGTAITAGIASVVAGLAGLALILPTIISGIVTMASIAIPALGSALAFLAANPIVLATAAIVGLGLALGKLIDKLVVARMVADIEKATSKTAKSTEEYIEKVKKLKDRYTELNQELEQIKASSPEFSKAQKERVKAIQDELTAIEKRLQYAKKAGISGAELPTITGKKTEALSPRQFALRQQEISLIEDKYEKEYQLALLARDRNVAKLKQELEDEKTTAAEKSIIREQIFKEDEILRHQFTEINKEALEAQTEQERKAQKELFDIRREFSDKYATYNYGLQYSNLKLTQEISEKYLAYNYEKQQENAERRKQLLQDIFDHNKKLREQEAEDEEENAKRRLKLLQRILEHNQKIRIEQEQNLKDLQDRTRGFGQLVAEIKHGQQQLKADSVRSLHGEEPQVSSTGDDTLGSMLSERLAQQATNIPTDLFNIFQERRQLERDANEQLIELEEEKQSKIAEIRQRGNLSHIERLRQIEQAEKESADKRKQIEATLQKAKTASFTEYVNSFLSGIAKVIAAELKKQAIMAAFKFAGTAIGGPVGGLLTSAAGSMVLGGGFDNPAHDAMARQVGSKTAMMHGASFDNPKNDLSARLRGTMTASKSLGERSAADMLSNFSKGFEGQADKLGDNGEAGNDLSPILSKLESRLAETPKFQLFIDGKPLTAEIRREIDKRTVRGDAY